MNSEKLNDYLDKLYQDIYDQPEDRLHTIWAEDVIEKFVTRIPCNTVLDVGCGTGFCQDTFEKFGVTYTGVTLGQQDYNEGKSKNRNVYLSDMSDLSFDDNSFDLVFARHSLEHSPFPILTLMEWWRVSKQYLLLVAPSPDYWTWAGKNHYSITNDKQLWWWLARSGWRITMRQELQTHDDLYVKYYADNQKRIRENSELVSVPGAPETIEYRYLCKKVEPRLE